MCFFLETERWCNPLNKGKYDLETLATLGYTCPVRRKAYRHMSTLNLRVVVRLVTLFALVLALSLTGWASSLNQGSTATTRTNNDTFSGGVYIYNGGSFTNGESVTVFNWFDSGVFTGSSDLTPLLFTSDGSGNFTVAAIGAQETVDGSLQAGSNLVTGTNWTFGFLEGGINSGGVVSATTAGGIPFNALEGPPGVGGLGTTNDWRFTPQTDVSITTVAVGTVFGANGTFALNSGTGPNADRTYSANANGIISGVAEPGTFSLITGAGLVLAGLFRYRYVRSRRD